MKKIIWILICTLLISVGVGLYLYFSKTNSPGKLELKAFISNQSIEQPVITVNQHPIKLGMLLEEVKKKGGHIPGRFDSDDQRQQLINELIHFELLAQEAKKLDYHKDPEIQLAYKKMLVAKFKREQIQTKLSEIIITDNMIKDFYENHIDNYKDPAMHRIAIIFIRKPLIQNKSKIKNLKKKASQVRQIALQQNSRDFGKLAAKYSDDVQTKYKGGAMPWFTEKSRNFRLEPTIVKEGFKLRKKGNISKLIETKTGFYLLKLIDLRPEKTKPLDAVRLQIQADLKASLKQKWLDEFHQKLKESAIIETNDKLLDEDVIWKSQAAIQSQVPTFPAN